MVKTEKLTVWDERTKNNQSYEAGDLVTCFKCGKLMLVDIGCQICPECETDDLMWAHQEINEVDDFFFEDNDDFELLNISEVKRLWGEFGDVPMNPETECIESPWNGFPSGTHRETIWRWFEDTFHVSLVDDLMYF